MPAKTEEAASGAMSAVTSDAAAKPAADGQAAATNNAPPAAPPSFDAVFNAYLTPLFRAVKEIRKELREARDAAAVTNATGPAAGSGESAAARPTAASDDLLKSLISKLETLEKVLGNAGGEADLRKALAELGDKPPTMGPQALEQMEAKIRADMRDLVKALIDFKQAVDGRLARIEEAAKSPAPVATPVAVPVQPQFTPPSFPAAEIEYDQWKEIILGEELCQDHSIGDARNRLFRGVAGGDDAAKALAGTMLLVQAATPDRLPPLMKDVGEAYYRWKPKTPGISDPFETALIGYLKRRCDAGGLGNTIELVNVGDRFDIARHNASERGAVITAVHGWVVLRDNGKVYTKANVSVK